MRGKEKIRTLLEAGRLPEDMLFDSACIVMNGRTSVMIEGQRGVIELTDHRIRLKTGNGILSVCGVCLQLRELSPEKAVISGMQIEGIAYQ